MKPYRIVWHEDSDTTRVTAATHGTDGVLNSRAGRFLEKFAASGPEYAYAYADGERQFMTQAKGHGWISADNELNASFRKAAAGPLLSRLQIELSLRCNLSCSYCYSESGPDRRDSLAVADIYTLLADAEQCGVTNVDFTGGEFFLFKGWREILAEARHHGLVVSVHTNGTALTDSNVEVLARVGVRRVQVSADSHIAAEHDAIRGHRGAHSRTVEGIRRCVARDISLTVVLIAHKNNKATFLESVSWFKEELGVHVAIDRVVSTGGALHDPVALTTGEYYDLVAPLLSARTSESRICESPSVADGIVPEPHCGIAHSFIYITADGTYSLCPTMTHREEERFRGPSVRDMSLWEAWSNGPLFNQYRGLNCENAVSHKCSSAMACGGGCRSNAYLDSGRLTAPDYMACNEHKNPTRTFIDFSSLYSRGQYRLGP